MQFLINCKAACIYSLAYSRLPSTHVLPSSSPCDDISRYFPETESKLQLVNLIAWTALKDGLFFLVREGIQIAHSLPLFGYFAQRVCVSTFCTCLISPLGKLRTFALQ